METAEKAFHDEYTKRLPSYGEFKELFEKDLQIALKGIAHIDRVSVRVKAADSIVKKVFHYKKGKYANPLVDIEDQIAARIIVFFSSDVKIVEGILRSRYNSVEAKDKSPTELDRFGYQSFHMVITLPVQCKGASWGSFSVMPNTMELQVRTLFEHAWAEPQHDLGYKGPVELTDLQRRSLYWVAASAWGCDKVYSDLIASALAKDNPKH